MTTDYTSLAALLINTFLLATPPSDLFAWLGALMFIDAAALGGMSLLRFRLKLNYVPLFSLTAIVVPLSFIASAGEAWLKFFDLLDFRPYVAGSGWFIAAVLTIIAGVDMSRLLTEKNLDDSVPVREFPKWFSVAADLVTDFWVVFPFILGALSLFVPEGVEKFQYPPVIVSLSLMTLGILRAVVIVRRRTSRTHSKLYN
jgi:hypothetical protein